MSSSDRVRVPVDKIFFIIACVYLGFVIAWLGDRRQLVADRNHPPEISPSDRQFIAYLQSSLDLIDRQARTPAVKPSPSPVVSLPLPPPISPTTPKVIERVYVPVYPQTPATPSRPAITATAPLPPPPAPTLTTPPVLPPIPTSDKVKNTLVGVMELGDRSSALFDNQGITTRISTGEFINGWTLLGVRNQQVILTRGGKTKVLEVGQSF